MDYAAVPLEVKRYGAQGPLWIVLHGGPGAPGSAAGLARLLSHSARVLEPYQRSVDCSVAAHIADLHGLIEAQCPASRPLLAGHSWGAMLALCYGAAHPGRAAGLALLGCGTFDPLARAEYKRRFEAALTQELRAELAVLDGEPDPDRRLAARGRLIDSIYTVEALEPCEDAVVSVRAHRETWEDAMRLEAAGIYPAAFSTITGPVLMLHGAQDPHPGALIADSLRRYVPQLEYIEFARCGHSPWNEAAARAGCLAALERLAQNSSSGRSLSPPGLRESSPHDQG